MVGWIHLAVAVTSAIGTLYSFIPFFLKALAAARVDVIKANRLEIRSAQGSLTVNLRNIDADQARKIIAALRPEDGGQKTNADQQDSN